MKALFIANGISATNGVPGVSGGDMRWLSVAKVWQNQGVEVHVLTTDAGREFCRRFGLEAEIHSFGSLSGVGKVAYIDRGLHAWSIPSDLRGFEGLIYSTTELIYDVIPGSKMRRRNPANRLGVVSHWVAPMVRQNTSLLNSLMFYANNRAGLRYANRYADVLFGVSGPTKRSMVSEVHIPEDRIIEVACGVDYPAIQAATTSTQKFYDAVFMKRLEGTKGIWDLLRIWKKVVEARPGSKLLVLGGGSQETISRIKAELEANGISDNVTLYGPVYDFDKKFSLLAQSKTFVLPTYEENWAIVIGEALAAGLPVMCYDLPEIRPVWEDSITWVPKGNIEGFAQAILRFLDDPSQRSLRSEQGRRFVQRYDWEEIGQKELTALLSTLTVADK